MPTRKKATLRAIDSNIIHVQFPTRTPDLCIFVDGKPVTENHNRRMAGWVTKNGRVQYQSEDTVAWRRAVMVAVKNALRGRKLTPPIAVACVFVNCTGDAPNYLKTTVDAIQDATGINDKLYRPMMVDGQKHKGHPKGAVIHLWGDTGPGGVA